MATRKIVLVGDDVLRKRSKEVTAFDHKLGSLIDDMVETMYKNDGAGLAAPQVGVLKRVVVIDVDDHLYELVNPIIISATGVQEGPEGCLSIPGRYGTVERPNEVTVHAQDRSGKPVTVTGSEMLARALCHELDHLDGKLYPDLAKEMFEEEKERTRQKKSEPEEEKAAR